VYEEYPTKREVLDEEYNYVMLSMLMNTSRIKNGTALRLRGSKYKFRNEIAAKTGTTQNNSDGWFIGIVPTNDCGCLGGCRRPFCSL
jgi:penicillin-binding protein 1A